jgi:hypothetical protein
MASDLGNGKDAYEKQKQLVFTSLLIRFGWVVVVLLVAFRLSSEPLSLDTDRVVHRERRTVTLNDGKTEMPLLGLGTWRAEPGVVAEAVTSAVSLGYTHIDCADRYGNQREIGGALQAMRDDSEKLQKPLFVTSKLWNTDHAPERVRPAVVRMLKELR